ncbi:hypothetical protein Q5Y75_16090 [Ruegeria sp. 2205SS24-7]|uniref:hypothetical protein n=1 Tax=Ruegeria discodermiae TaxID=3064389 RepID=UPI002741455E|nr:hypothetical protein [Ruegeria sp. 2205SS24-7]MDP5218750.1 hypothetical protein [Ruegeria sp. 2205SS24-7]
MITMSFPAYGQPISGDDAKPKIITYRRLHIAQSLSAQPDLSGLLSAKSTGYLFADITKKAGKFDFAADRQSVWARLQGSWFENEHHLRSYFFGAAGAHFSLTPNAIAGVMLQFDQMIQESFGAGSTGKGYLIGPYFVAKLQDQPLYFEVRYLRGRTETDFIGFGSAVEDIVSEQTLATLEVSGQLIFDDFTLTPHLLYSHLENSQQPFVDNETGRIAEQSMTVTGVVAGLDYSKHLRVQSGDLDFTSGISVSWSETVARRFGSTLTEDFGGMWGRVHMGATYTIESDFKARASVAGIVTDSDQNWGIDLELEMRF